ncbi:hypothetical protein [Kitasatospora sp. HPMI-4]|uniref:hypothetical protein n=1 Tax=Kitasatospora sp. HPMI-4 TaxID=3448443 RepID=UPI003F1BEC98
MAEREPGSLDCGRQPALQEATFDIPSPPRINAHAEVVAVRHLHWAEEFGLIRSASAIERYRSWRPADVASMWYLHAKGDDLALGADISDGSAGPPRLAAHPLAAFVACTPLTLRTGSHLHRSAAAVTCRGSFTGHVVASRAVPESPGGAG